MILNKLLFVCTHYGMKQLASCFMLLICITSNVFAQGENNNWCFGKQLGLSFNTNPPSPFMDSTLLTGASVSDAAGNLLFYVSDSTVRDKNHNIMPNGHDVFFHDLLNFENVIIVQSPTNTNQYYIIVSGNLGSSKATYSLVDITLNNGLGDVVAGQNKIAFATDVGPELECAKISGGCDGYWIILHSINGDATYKAFKLSSSSLFTDSVLSIGMQPSAFALVPTTSLSTEGSTIVRCKPENGGVSGSIETATFNTATGMLSNFQYLETTLEDVEYPIFSPDGSKLYSVEYNSSSMGSRLYQYNMTLMPNIVAVKNSKTLIATDWAFGDSRIGPDGKIYSIHYPSVVTAPPDYLSIINNPNALGTACNYVPNGLVLPTYMQTDNYYLRELGGEAYVKSPFDTLISPIKDTTICYNKNLILAAPTDYQSPVWSTGSTNAQEIFTQPGTYWLRGIKNCTIYIDTFHIHYPYFEVNLGNDTSICEGKPLLLNASLPGNVSYLWQDGSISPDFTVSNEGNYSVAVTKDGCTLSDTISVGLIHPTLDIQEHDTIICKGERITLHALAHPQSSFQWNTVSTESSIQTNGAKTYMVTATNICGTLQDSVQVQEKICPCIVFVPNAFTPNSDGKNDVLEVNLRCPLLSGYTFAVFNRYGQKMFQSSVPGQGWDGSNKGNFADAGTYFFYLKYKDGETEVKKKGDITLIR